MGAHPWGCLSSWTGAKAHRNLPRERLSWNSHTARPASLLGKDLMASASGPLFHPLGHWGPGLAQ